MDTTNINYMTTSKTAPDILEDAADYIAVNGHCKGEYYRGDAACAIGAMQLVDYSAAGELSKACAALRAEVGEDRIYDWNDESTADHVIDTMRRVAKDLRNEANICYDQLD